MKTAPYDNRNPLVAASAYRPPPPSLTYCHLRLEELDARIEALRVAQANASTSQAPEISSALLIAEDEKMSIERMLRI